jgi:hypothetical protein
MSSRTTKDIVSKFAELPEDQREALISGALQAIWVHVAAAVQDARSAKAARRRVAKIKTS